jgi:hypothetical protein
VAEVNLWGDAIPAWLGAIGTCGATGFAVFIAWHERKRAEKAEAERDELREAAHAGVASRVAGWLEETQREPRNGLDFDRRESWRANVKNASDQAVLNVKAYVVHHDGSQADLLGEWAVVPPLETVYSDAEVMVQGFNEKPYLRLTFEDPAGRRWVRGELGRLSPAPTEEAAPATPDA